MSKLKPLDAWVRLSYRSGECLQHSGVLQIFTTRGKAREDVNWGVVRVRITPIPSRKRKANP